jgi:ABC-type glycerol-3-phosphate transport system substrate-binding protein
MRRLAVALVVAAALAAACGGVEEDAPAPAPAPAAEPAPATSAPPATAGPTEAELVFREKILEEIKSGKYKCHCTSAERARERIEKGLAEEPPRSG